jgi:uncharacterized protein with ParB-like and HNH nuclease domain
MRFASLFRENRTVETLSLAGLLEWHLHDKEGKLLLATIQRSLVWSNAQVINYWDSLLRGYPSGGRRERLGRVPINRPAVSAFGQSRHWSRHRRMTESDP